MELKKLMTLTFEKNVGTRDRAHRFIVGAALGAVGWVTAVPLWAAVVLSVLGAMWFLTGVLSKCTIYYLLGYSTCPVATRGVDQRA